jgi:DNA-binding transcriptional LysR family regulator
LYDQFHLVITADMDKLTKTLLYRLRTKHLKTLEVLGRVESMRAAANELNISQPAITKILQDIEEILDVKLFDRNSSGISPTPIGRAVVSFSRKSVSDVERFAGLITNLKLGGYGSLRIGTIMASIPEFVPLSLKKLKEQRPLMTIHLVAATSNKLIEELNNQTIDMAVARLTDPEQNALFDFEPLLGEEVWVFVGADHPFATMDRIGLYDLFDEPWVLQPPMSPLRQLLQQSFADLGKSALPNWIETDSIYTTLKLVGLSGMIAALPRTILEDGVASGEFVRLPVKLSHELTRYGIVTRKDTPRTENMDLFAAVLRETARETIRNRHIRETR